MPSDPGSGRPPDEAAAVDEVVFETARRVRESRELIRRLDRALARSEELLGGDEPPPGGPSGRSRRRSGR